MNALHSNPLLCNYTRIIWLWSVLLHLSCPTWLVFSHVLGTSRYLIWQDHIVWWYSLDQEESWLSQVTRWVHLCYISLISKLHLHAGASILALSSNCYQQSMWDSIFACHLLQITFTAKPGLPVKLEPETIPATPTVSNTQRNNGRLLVKTLKLQLKVFYSTLVSSAI